MASVLALVSSVLWGLGDFVGGLASRRARPLQVLLVSMPVGLLLVTPIALLVGGDARGSFGPGVGAGVFGTVGLLCLYGALATGPMGVLAPVSAVLAAAIPVVVGLVSGERPGPLAYVGMALAVVAIVTVGLEPSAPTDDDQHQRVTPRALLLAIGAGLGFGLFFTVVSAAPDDAGLWPAVWARALSSVLVAVIALVLYLRTGARPLETSRATLGLSAVAGCLDASANGLYVVAVQTGLLSVVSVLGSLYPAATVLLARFVLGERVERTQDLGVLVTLVGIVLISAG